MRKSKTRFDEVAPIKTLSLGPQHPLPKKPVVIPIAPVERAAVKKRLGVVEHLIEEIDAKPAEQVDPTSLIERSRLISEASRLLKSLAAT